MEATFQLCHFFRNRELKFYQKWLYKTLSLSVSLSQGVPKFVWYVDPEICQSLDMSSIAGYVNPRLCQSRVIYVNCGICRSTDLSNLVILPVLSRSYSPQKNGLKLLLRMIKYVFQGSQRVLQENIPNKIPLATSSFANYILYKSDCSCGW